MTRVYEEIIDFIAGGPTSEDVASWKASPEVRDRAADLLTRQKSSELAADEVEELNHFLELEHIMRLAKARARERSANE